jgi:hypothetical protein
MPGREDLWIVVHEPQFAVEELRNVEAAQPDDAELWVERESARMCVLLSSGRALLLFMRHSGDPGFSSRNPAFDPQTKSVHRFRLSNGQVDEYPVAWTYSSDDAFRALQEFAASGRVPDDMAWHNDSEDGQASPNAGPA